MLNYALIVNHRDWLWEKYWCIYVLAYGLLYHACLSY